MSAETRTRLATMQADLVAALSGRAAFPAGFDADQLRAAATALVSKRCRAVSRTWPGLAEALGGRFAEYFEAFAIYNAPPEMGGPLADGRAFARWLPQTEIPDAARLQALAVDLRHVTTPAGLVPRYGPIVKCARMRKPRRLVVAIRLPWLRELWLSLPCAWSRA